MKLALATAILVFVSPLALADQSHVVGPASVVTSNTDQGDACGGDNGYHVRSFDARVELFPGENVGASYSQWCVDQTGPGWYNHGNGFWLTVDHRVDNNAGPQVYAGYSDNDMNGWHNCGLYIGVVGIPTYWGCLPADSRVPLLPPLP